MGFLYLTLVALDNVERQIRNSKEKRS